MRASWLALAVLTTAFFAMAAYGLLVSPRILGEILRWGAMVTLLWAMVRALRWDLSASTHSRGHAIYRRRHPSFGARLLTFAHLRH